MQSELGEDSHSVSHPQLSIGIVCVCGGSTPLHAASSSLTRCLVDPELGTAAIGGLVALHEYIGQASVLGMVL